MPSPQRAAGVRAGAPAPERNETVAERSDRNWGELLQELRVTQTGVQILAGFLLTLPVQREFLALGAAQRVLRAAARHRVPVPVTERLVEALRDRDRTATGSGR